MNIHAPVGGRTSPDRDALRRTHINGSGDDLGGHTDETSKTALLSGQARRRALAHRASRYAVEAMRAKLTAQIRADHDRGPRERARFAAIEIMLREHVPPIARQAALERIRAYSECIVCELELLLLDHVPAAVKARWDRIAAQHYRAVEAAIAAQ
jgi:hypothetical protein